MPTTAAYIPVFIGGSSGTVLSVPFSLGTVLRCSCPDVENLDARYLSLHKSQTSQAHSVGLPPLRCHRIQSGRSLVTDDCVGVWIIECPFEGYLFFVEMVQDSSAKRCSYTTYIQRICNKNQRKGG